MPQDAKTYSPSPVIETAAQVPYRFTMRGSAEHTCKLPTAADVRVLGIVSEHSATAVGDAASVHYEGIVKLELDGAYNAGDRINCAGTSGKGKRASASYTSNMTNATDNDFVATAVEQGSKGNDITLELVDPGGASSTLAVQVQGRHISVTLGRAASAVDTTPTLLAAAIAANALAAALVLITNKTGNDGSGLVEALGPVQLSGGANDVCELLEASSADGDIRRVKLDNVK